MSYKDRNYKKKYRVKHKNILTSKRIESDKKLRRGRERKQIRKRQTEVLDKVLNYKY